MPRSSAKSISDIVGRGAIHPFPARMAPSIALQILENQQKSLRVLDPMAGSGTVLAVARACGHVAVGIDIDPLSVLLSQVWTTTIYPKDAYEIASDVLSRAKQRSRRLTLGFSYPEDCDFETRQFLRYWFDGNARKQLTALSSVIAEVNDVTARNVLWSGFSRLIISKQAGASLALDLSHSRPHRHFTSAPLKPFDGFLSAVTIVISNCLHRNCGPVGPRAVVTRGDARDLKLKSNSVDVVLTSPPYLNAIDYMRCSKFSLVWMGWNVGELRDLRRISIGTEMGLSKDVCEKTESVLRKHTYRSQLPVRQRAILARYVSDMHTAVSEAARVLVPGGRAIYVVGENTIRGTFVRNSRIMRDIALLCGLRQRSEVSRLLPQSRRYLPPPTKHNPSVALSRRMRREVVLTFEK